MYLRICVFVFVYLTLTRPIGQKKSRTHQNMSYIWSGVPLSYLQLYGSLIVWSQHFRSLLSEGVPRVPSTFNFFQGKLKFVSPLEVRGGTIRGPGWHHSRSGVAPFEVPGGTIRGPMLWHHSRSRIQILGPKFFSLGRF